MTRGMALSSGSDRICFNHAWHTMNEERTIKHWLFRAIAISLAIGAAQTSLAAGFVNDKRGWMALSNDARISYAQGLNDSQNFVYVDDTVTDALVKIGRTKCLIELKTSAARLAENITFKYQDSAYAGLAPAAIYIIAMGEVCKLHINRERNVFGLGPM